MTAVLLWLRLDGRRRWRSLATLAILLAMSGTLVLAVTAGARRDGSAMERLRAESLPATAMVLPNTPGFDWDAIRALPEVEAVGEFPVGAVFGIDGINPNAVGFPNGSVEGYVDLERGAMTDGRMFDNFAVDEAVVNQSFVDKYHVSVGDTLTARMFTPAQLRAHADDAEPPSPRIAKGPTQTLRIVGVGLVPWIFAVGGDDSPGILTTYGLFHRYEHYMVPPGQFSYVNALVRLRHGESDLPLFQADLAQVTGRNDIEVTDLTAGAKRVTNATSFEHDSLLLFAFCAAIAAMLIVGQAIVRYTSSAVADLDVLRSLGLTRRESLLAAAGGPVLATAAAAVVSVIGAYLASPLFPIGVGATVEPHPGRHADWTVLATGALALLALVTLVACVTAVNALRGSASTGSYHRSGVANWTSRLGLPVPLTLGTRLALEPGRGRTAVPVRPAMVGAVVGVLGLVAAATFHAGLSDATSNPERYGQSWQAGGFLGLNGHDFVKKDRLGSTLTTLADRPEVAGLNDLHVVPITVGAHSLTMFELTPIGGGITPVSLSGREPRAVDEIALGPLTAKQLDAHVGDQLDVRGERSLPLTVSGITFVPAALHNAYDEGAWVTGATMAKLYPSGFFKFHLLLARFQPGTDVKAAIKAIGKDTGIGFDPNTPPADVTNLRTVRLLPTLMGAFLALLAVGAVGHALATAVRRRRHDMAVLRALGLTHGQVRATVAWQATTLAVVGLVFGIPLGLALARTLWRVVAERTPVQYVPPLALLALVLVVPLSVLVANVLAAFPGQRAVRQRIGAVLRAE
jgi:hypothetical protein